MFKFNVKSDLKDGRLVTPISATENDTVICLDETGNEIELEFDDFDFEKTEDERYFVIEDIPEEPDSSEDIIVEPEPEEPIIKEPDSSEDIIVEPEPEEPIIKEPDSSEDIIVEEPDSSEDTPVINPITENKKSGWVTDLNEKAAILYGSGYEPTKPTKDVNIWRDVIL